MNTIQEAFIGVFNTSITATYIAIGVMLIRLLFKKLPKSYSYALWSAVLLRLVCPISFKSAVSYLGLVRPTASKSATVFNYVPNTIDTMQAPILSAIDNFSSAMSSTQNPPPDASERGGNRKFNANETCRYQCCLGDRYFSVANHQWHFLLQNRARGQNSNPFMG